MLIIPLCCTLPIPLKPRDILEYHHNPAKQRICIHKGKDMMIKFFEHLGNLAH